MIENTFSKGGVKAALSTNEFLLDSFEWSFSRVNAYVQCPRMFYLQYMEDKDKRQNAFAEWGTLCHGILESYFRGELSLLEICKAYKEKYAEYMQHDFPPNKYKDLNESYYQAGIDYFSSFEGLPSNYEVIGVEQEIHLMFGKYHFVGYIDLILKDKKDGRYIIVDHKSKSGFKNNEELSHYLLQLYLYSQYIYEIYHEYPKELVFNMFRANSFVWNTFDEKEFHEAVRWFISTIESIYQEIFFRDKIAIEYSEKKKDIDTYKEDDFFCNYLCSVGNDCCRCGRKV
ncbi:MAG: PD-(D/E)XK nuclease family protein [Clostridia bacterium]|nr:PD-(D/E)XK nuclease family protein [Clostridia bacterium]